MTTPKLPVMPEKPSSGKTTLLRDIIRIQASGPVIVIDTSSEITSTGVRHLITRESHDPE